jgi:rSAM/selenodomain-associated transferase 1
VTQAVLGLFAKRPDPGRVKTRLAADTSPEWAARVADAFLRDTVERFAAVPARRVLAFTPPDAQDFFAALVGGRFELTPQADGDLGCRLGSFADGHLRAGARKVVLVGTDSPTLPVEWVTQAFAELDSADVILGPATDGGYYLIGLTPNAPPLFDGIVWSGPDVLRATVERLTGTPHRLALLPAWYDVDTFDDWRVLRGHLTALKRSGRDPGVPCTDRLPDPP